VVALGAVVIFVVVVMLDWTSVGGNHCGAAEAARKAKGRLQRAWTAWRGE
jgi:hypothetical protein